MKISIKALAIGCLVSIGGAVVVALINFATFYFNLFPTFLDDTLTTRQLLSYGYFVISILFNMLAGYSCARYARKEELLHGVLLGILIWFISLVSTYFLYTIVSNYQLTFGLQQFIALLWPMSACLLGAFISKRISDKRNEENSSPLEQKIENLGNN